MLVFQHSLVQTSIAFHCVNLFLFTTSYLMMWGTGLFKARRQGLQTNHKTNFPYRTERMHKKLIIQRNYLNSRQFFPVNIVKYFKILFMERKSPFFCPLNCRKECTTYFFKKSVFFLVYTETLQLKHQLFESTLNITETRGNYIFVVIHHLNSWF